MMKSIIFTMVAIIVVLSVVPASSVNSVEIRSSVFEGGSSSYIIDSTNFAGFYYDLDGDMSTEYLAIENFAFRTIPTSDLVYYTSIQNINYASDNIPGVYGIMGLFGEKYVPLKANTPDKLSKLLLDSDQRHHIASGTTLQLPKGYELTAKQIDVDGNKVWMEFSRDGEFIDDEIIDVSSSGNKLWTYEADIAGEDDVIVMKVYVNNVFQGQVDRIAVIEGIWLLDHDDVLEINLDDTFDKLKVVAIGPNFLLMENYNSITLTRNRTISIANGMSFKVADSSTLRFYLMKEFTELGTYEIRGNVVTGSVPALWTAADFAGFYYNLHDNISTELLEITNVDSNIIATGDLQYRTSIQTVNHASANIPGTYDIIGLFGEVHVPLKSNTPDKLSRLLLDSDARYTLRTGATFQLPGSYELTAKQIDVYGNKVWMEFSKEGEFIDDEILDVSGGATAVWTYMEDIAGEEDVIVMKIAVVNVFQGEVDSLVVVDGIWLVDYENVLEIEPDDSFDRLEVVAIGSDQLLMSNPVSINLTRGRVITIAEGMSFRVADDSLLRYYPFIEITVDNETVIPPEVPVELGAYTMSLHKGWNLVSIPIYPYNPSIAVLFDDYDDVLVPVYSWNTANKQYYEAENLEIGKGYWVLALNDTLVRIEGIPYSF